MKINGSSHPSTIAFLWSCDCKPQSSMIIINIPIFVLGKKMDAMMISFYEIWSIF